MQDRDWPARRFAWVGLLIAAAAVVSVSVTWQVIARAAESPIAVWWPTNDAHVSGLQPFKAVLQASDVTQYRLSWSVDGGRQNAMQPTRQDGPHYESEVDVTSWNWRGQGPYAVTFRATDMQGQMIAERTTQLYVTATSAEPARAQAPSATVVPTPAPTVVPTPQPTPSPSPRPSATTFYVNPLNPALRTAAEWAPSRPTDAAILQRIGSTPTAQWFGDWNKNLTTDIDALVGAANRVGQMPVLVAYNVPQRDCGSYSAGGLDAAEYGKWIAALADGIGNRPALVILEPDALAQISCLSTTDQALRLNLLSQAIKTLKAHAQTKVYLDAGHAHWIGAASMASLLRQANVAAADGFSLNISNFMTTSDNTAYGRDISSRLSGKHFIIDTSRNGLGPTTDNQWCNPFGRGLGAVPGTKTADPLIDTYVWAKVAGESDGRCNGGPSAGTWWPDYALNLARNVSF